MTTQEQIQDYCYQNNIQLTNNEIDEAVDLVDNEGYSVENAVGEVLDNTDAEPGHPEIPT